MTNEEIKKFATEQTSYLAAGPQTYNGEQIAKIVEIAVLELMGRGLLK